MSRQMYIQHMGFQGEIARRVIEIKEGAARVTERILPMKLRDGSEIQGFQFTRGTVERIDAMASIMDVDDERGEKRATVLRDGLRMLEWVLEEQSRGRVIQSVDPESMEKDPAKADTLPSYIPEDKMEQAKIIFKKQ